MCQLIEDRVGSGVAMRTVGMHGTRPSICFGKADSETPVSPSGSEDFATFTNVISGCFVFVRGGDAGDGPPRHEPPSEVQYRREVVGPPVKTEVRIVLDVVGVGWPGDG